jgi:aminotransferase
MKHQVARVVEDIRASVIREMSLRADALDDVISLGIGEPDFHTEGRVCHEALRDALGGATHYAPSQGDRDLLEALAATVNAQHGLGITQENLVVTLGGMGALTHYFRTILDPGDEVLVPEPHFPSYRPHIEWAGGRVVHVPTKLEEGFVVKPEAIATAITPKSKVLLLNSPNNPTGAVIPGGTLDAVADLVKERDILVVSDEVYDRLVFDGRRHESIITRPDLFERTVVVNSFSKSYAMTGWRVGYAYGPRWIIEPMTKVVSHCTSCTPSVSQRAALAALRMDPAVVEEMAWRFAARSELLYQGLSRLPGFRVNKPAGSFYMFPDVSQLTDDTYQFALDLLQEERVAVVPGFPFGPSGVNCIRLACTVGRDKIAEAVGRIERFVTRRLDRSAESPCRSVLR